MEKLSPPLPTISVVIPAYDAARTLPACLAALAQTSPLPYEVIVVDDASRDETGAIAAEAGVRVVSLPANVGAARAKNRGAEAATGEILFFVDSDVVVGPDALALIGASTGGEFAGVVGVLAPAIPYADFASQFKNLWMRFTYLRMAGAAAAAQGVGLFYTSAAAIRRDVFRDLQGFDENYRDASIVEDNEFGQRAWAGGHRLVVDPRLAVTHLRPYTVGQLLRTDWMRARALTMLRLRKWGRPFFTSVPGFFQLAVPALFAALALGLGALGLALLRNAASAAAALAALGVGLFFVLANAPLLKFLAEEKGGGFALRALLFLPLDVFFVGLGMLRAVVDFARGRRY